MTSDVAIRSLNTGWSVQGVSGPIPEGIKGKIIPATVPGSVHTDLLAAGLIDDPYLDDNEALLAWVGYSDWEYSTSFEWSSSGAANAELVFDGLDTVATIRLNGAVVASTINMHRTYRFDVRELLRDGANELVVTFASPIRYADRMSLELGARPHVNHHPFNSIRKMAASFGWDWGIDTSTVGIWRPVTLQEWSVGRLASVRPTPTVDGDSGTLTVRADVAGDGDGMSLRATIDGTAVTVPVAAGLATASITVDAVRRWWPTGFGDPALYDLIVELLRDDAVLDSWTSRVGFRSVVLDTSSDDAGTRMTFIVNGQPVFIRGANWIPDDAFPHRVTEERYARRIAQAKSANINLLRIWGGGIYESDDFYRLCDESGVMVWQDFLLACAAYAEEEPLWSEVEAEARDNVARIMPHPSLVYWNGSNENLEGFHDWGWQPRLEGKTWGAGYYDDLLPSIVAELDPGRAYGPSSPFSAGADAGPNDPAHGSIHIWDVWNLKDYESYRDKRPRFVAEYGWQGPPTMSALRQSIADDPLTPESPGMLVHQKAADGAVKLPNGLVKHFRLPNTMVDWHWAMSLNQAIAMQVGIEHLRSLSPHCMGSIVWQLNDLWPVTSWAAIDGYGRAKPLLYGLRHAYADALVTIQPRGDELAVVVVNDSPDPLVGPLRIERLSFSGEVLEAQEVAVEISPRSTQTVLVANSVAVASDVAGELLVATLGGFRGTWFFAEYKHSALGPALMDATAARTEDGYSVSVTATSLIRDLAVLVDQVDPDAEVDDMLLTLLPGETAQFTIRSSAEVDPQAFLAPQVLRSGNDLVESA